MAALDLLPSSTVATACILIFSAWIAYFIAKFLRIYFLISNFDGPPALPLFGNSYCFKKDPREMALSVEKIREKYRKSTGGLIRMWYGPVPAIIIYSAKHCEVLINSSRHINKGTLYKFLEPWLGKGLLTSTGEKWHHRRKLLTPAFHFSISFKTSWTSSMSKVPSWLRNSRKLPIQPSQSTSSLWLHTVH